jgi:hypothetical protein
MDQFKLSGVSVAADTNGLADDSTAATSISLIANDAGDSLAHEITILNNSGVNHSGKTVAIVGTNSDGGALSHTITGPAGSSTVTTTGVYFLTVTSVEFSATAGANTFDVGWNLNSVTETQPFTSNADKESFGVGFGVSVDSGSPTYGVQHTYGGSASSWFAHPTVTGETTAQEGSYSTPILAMRLQFTAAGGATLSGVRNTG